MDRLRVASLQYYVRPITAWRQFEEQVEALVATAHDYSCHLIVFPEYFTTQLLTLGDVRRPMTEQVRDLAGHAPRVFELLARLARQHGLHIVGGTVPVADEHDADKVYNDCPVVSPEGTIETQGKMHMTRFENEEWLVSPRKNFKLFDTEIGKLAVNICYDVEFPELARAVAREGATMLIVPSCTDDRQGFLRVRLCAHARAIENQMYVIHSGTVGSLPQVPAVSLNYSQASILTPSDFPFARDGILAEGVPNQETMVIGELDMVTLRRSRRRGTVLPLRDSLRSSVVARTLKTVDLHQPASSGQSGKGGRKKRVVQVRNTQEADFRGIMDMCRLIYPDALPWAERQLTSHLEVFPEGQFVAVEESTGLVVGMSSSLIIDWDDYDRRMDWSSFTADGMYTNHDPVNGSTLYAADVMVRPGQQGRGVGKRLYKQARFGLAEHLGLWRIRAGARLRGYHRVAKKMTPEDYVVQVIQERLRDPTLSFQLKLGFRVISVVDGYLTNDPESLGYAAVIEWLNPDVAEPSDWLKGDPRYRVAAPGQALPGPDAPAT